MRAIFWLVMVVSLTACNSPQRFEANRSAARAWLSSQAGSARGNVTGTWRDATPDAWGDASLEQRGNKITGTLGNYEVEGVMNGSRLYLALKSDNWFYYSVEAVHKGPVIEGLYARGVPSKMTKAKSRPFEFRRVSGD